MPGHRQPLASPDGEVFSPRCRKDVLCGWHMVLYARPLFRKKRRKYKYNYPIFLNFFQNNCFETEFPSWVVFSLPRHKVNYLRRIKKTPRTNPECRYFAFYESAIPMKSSALRAAPPISPPSMSFCAKSSLALEGLQEPP